MSLTICSGLRVPEFGVKLCAELQALWNYAMHTAKQANQSKVPPTREHGFKTRGSDVKHE